MKKLIITIIVILIYLPGFAQEKANPFCTNKIYIKEWSRELNDLVHNVMHIYGFEKIRVDVHPMPKDSNRKQMIEGDLEINGDEYTWKGETHKGSDVSYRKRGFEIEAYKESKKLAYNLRTKTMIEDQVENKHLEHNHNHDAIAKNK